MDPISQAGLGALAAQSVATRDMGPRVLVWGAVAGAMPDLDVLFSLGGDAFDALVTHRGITHSFLFAFVAGPILGLVLWRRDRGGGTDSDTRIRWMLAMLLAVVSHPLLDVLTPYGTQLLMPFSDRRFAVNAMPIIDPVYTASLLIGGFLAWRARNRLLPARVAAGALLVSSSYLGYGYLMNERAAAEGQRQLASAGLTGFAVTSFPTVLQVHYRRLVAVSPQAVLVGYVSTWRPCSITWGHNAPSLNASDPRVRQIKVRREGRVFDWFAMGWAHYTAHRRAPHGLEILASDLRYGVNTRADQSLFQLRAEFSESGVLTGRPVAGRDISLLDRADFAGFLSAAYPDGCPEPPRETLRARVGRQVEQPPSLATRPLSDRIPRE